MIEVFVLSVWYVCVSTETRLSVHTSVAFCTSKFRNRFNDYTSELSWFYIICYSIFLLCFSVVAFRMNRQNESFKFITQTNVWWVTLVSKLTAVDWNNSFQKLNHNSSILSKNGDYAFWFVAQGIHIIYKKNCSAVTSALVAFLFSLPFVFRTAGAM